MSLTLRSFTAALCGLLAVVAVARADEPTRQAKPQVEVVFCLDTTGSMGGLINAAKQKIWAISNQIVTGTPTPTLKVGLIAYRDRGDEYVTKIFDLTDNLDAVHANLMGFQAQGGGDTPESVNQALHEAVTKIRWSQGKHVLKIIFLVGDAPPKDYPNDVKYPEICQLAAKNSIIINTVQCGGDANTRDHWQKICRLAEGSYVQIDAAGGPVVVVATPFDEKLAKINGELAKTTLGFGGALEQKAAEKQKTDALRLAAPAAADRAAFYANSHRGASYDLLENVQNGKIKLETLKKEELPPELRGKTLDEQKAFLKELADCRDKLNRQAVELDKKRQAFIATKQKEDARNRPQDSFDGQVLTILQNQAGRIQVRYEAVEPKKK